MSSLHFLMIFLIIASNLWSISAMNSQLSFENMTRAHLENRTAKRLIADMRKALNGSNIYLEYGLALRYSFLLDTIHHLMKEINNSTVFNQTTLCLKAENLLRHSMDSCLRPHFWMNRDHIIACQFTERNLTLSKELISFCNWVTKQMNKTSPTRHSQKPLLPPVEGFFGPTRYLLIAVKLIVRTVGINFERRCQEQMGFYDEQHDTCQFREMNNRSVNESERLKSKRINEETSLTYLSIVGNVASCILLFILIITYIIYNKHRTLPGKMIMSLSAGIILSNILQVLIIFFGRLQTICAALGILLHWVFLFSFLWMALLSYDFFISFNKFTIVDRFKKQSKFKAYILIAFLLPVSIVSICLLSDIPNKKITIYGQHGRCFVARFWANLFAFVIPVALILAVNIVLLCFTMNGLKVAKARSRRLSTTASNRKEIILTLLALKISVLVGIAWVMAFIDGFFSSRIVEYIYTFLVTFQGVFVYLAFGCYKKIYTSIKTKLNHQHAPKITGITDTKL